MPRRTLTIAATFLAATLALTGCDRDRNLSTSADAAAELGQPATPATPPASKEPAVQPTPPGTPPGTPAAQPGEPAKRPDAANVPLDLELFAYQATGLTDAQPQADAAANPQAIVLLVARGKHRSGGWSSELLLLPIRIFPPQFELRTTPPGPDSMNMQMLTPFTATAWIRLDQSVPVIKVRVGDELREVKVEPAAKAKPAMPGR
jgi:hypothetical protein